MKDWDQAQAVALRDFIKLAPSFMPTLRAAITKIELKAGDEALKATGAAHAGGEKIVDLIQSLHDQAGGDGRSPYINTGTE